MLHDRSPEVDPGCSQNGDFCLVEPEQPQRYSWCSEIHFFGHFRFEFSAAISLAGRRSEHDERIEGHGRAGGVHHHAGQDGNGSLKNRHFGRFPKRPVSLTLRGEAIGATRDHNPITHEMGLYIGPLESRGLNGMLDRVRPRSKVPQSHLVNKDVRF